MNETLYYAPLADTVDAFSFTRDWRFVRRAGVNNWSLIGINDKGKVIYEIERLAESHVKKLIKSFDNKEMVNLVGTGRIPRIPFVETLNATLYWLNNSRASPQHPTREETVRLLELLLNQLKENQ